MREWFKARNMWGNAIQSLPDDAAGRLVKALWDYTMNGVIRELEGPEQYILPMFIATLEQDTVRDSEISVKRAMAGSMGGRQRVANEANAIFATQVLANEAFASNKNKNKNKNKNTEEDKERIRRFSPPSLEEVTEYCKSRGNHVDPENFINFYESKGWKVGNSPMKDWKACVRTWEKRDSENGKKVSAQQYEQRDYTAVQARIMDAQRERIAKRMSANNFDQRDYSGVNDELIGDLKKQIDRFKATGEVDS